ncbi:MAG: hypothetical protein RLY71_1353 [Pseudomonadota bacterium]|jgi:hypothetical protein
MDRLQSQLQRLYGLAPDPQGNGEVQADHACGLIGADGRVHALVLALGRPADWRALAPVWQGVQIDLQLPAPAIAVSGTDSYQLWFSLAEPVSAAQAQGFLEGLQARYLADVPARRIERLPAVDPAAPSGLRHASPVPAAQAQDDVWSAFVAPDLAPMFTDAPWLDLPPNREGQAELLARCASIGPADFRAALQQLQPAASAADPATAAAAPPPTGATRLSVDADRPRTFTDPRQFLLAVMNDERVELALRIQAAQALLPAGDTARG